MNNDRNPGFLRALADAAGSLPPVAAQVLALTSAPDCSLERLYRVIRADGALALRFLALANSAAFARGGELRDLRTALVRLGLHRVRNVALCLGMHDLCPAAGDDGPLDRVALWHHGLAQASWAKVAAAHDRSNGADVDDSYLLGLLQGLGPVIMARRGGDRFAAAVLAARRERWPLRRAERTLLGFDHDELTVRVLARWKLPVVLRHALAFHRVAGDAAACGPEVDALARALRRAERLARACGPGSAGDGDQPPAPATALRSLTIDPADGHELVRRLHQEVEAVSRLILGHEAHPGCRPAARAAPAPASAPTSAAAAAADAAAAAAGGAARALARMGLEGCEASLDRARLDEELNTARDIQRRLLPERLPDPPGYELAADFEPCGAVSGDIYDVVEREDGRLLLVLGDVTGKGLPAALLASNLQATVRALAARPGSPAELLTAAGRALEQTTAAEVFATLVLAELDPPTGMLRYAGAGHTPPLLRRGDGAVAWLEASGPPLGLLAGATYADAKFALTPGDVLILYTDGITEATDPDGRLLRTAGLARLVQPAASLPARDLVAAVRAGVHEHALGRRRSARAAAAALAVLVDDAPPPPREDDATLLVLRVLPVTADDRSSPLG
ncbi:MAG: SpoIIE family protein phosphatase [Candidatus Krumholzibacteriia bacterium]